VLLHARLLALACGLWVFGLDLVIVACFRSILGSVLSKTKILRIICEKQLFSANAINVLVYLWLLPPPSFLANRLMGLTPKTIGS
jgi:hypothetical protein